MGVVTDWTHALTSLQGAGRCGVTEYGRESGHSNLTGALRALPPACGGRGVFVGVCAADETVLGFWSFIDTQ